MSFKSFLESLQKGFEEESKRINERQSRSNYINTVQRFGCKSDGELLQEYNSSFASKDDKEIISKILESRGYTKREDGYYSRL